MNLKFSQFKIGPYQHLVQAYLNESSMKSRKCGKIRLTMRTLISCQGCRFQSSVVCPRNRNYSKDVSSDFLRFVKSCVESLHQNYRRIVFFVQLCFSNKLFIMQIYHVRQDYGPELSSCFLSRVVIYLRKSNIFFNIILLKYQIT